METTSSNDQPDHGTAGSSRASTNTRRTRAAIAAAAGLALIGGAVIASRSTAGTAPARRVAAPDSDQDWTSTECGTYTGRGCSPTEQRVDLTRPEFSNPTAITNRFFPVDDTVVQLGHLDDEPFRSETVRLPGTETVTWDGEMIETVQVQYVAWVGEQIDEVAIDRYAQADDGAVWYFGEDVYDYVDGAIVHTEGTWLAGRDGPPAMIMPATPKVGAVFRPENVIGIVFEEVEVTEVDKSVDGPDGPIRDAIVTRELHLDGSYSDKIFAPGIGEFRTGNDHELEAVAIDVPGRALSPGDAAAVARITTASWGALELTRAEEWADVSRATQRIRREWNAIRGHALPPLSVEQMNDAVVGLERAVKASEQSAISHAAVEVAQNAIDLGMRAWSVARVEAERFHLHAQRLRVSVAEADGAGVASDVASLEWISDRIVSSLSEGDQRELGAALTALRSAADSENLAATGDHAARVAAWVRVSAQ